MPTFSVQRPQSLAQSFATLLGSGSGMTIDDAVKIEGAKRNMSLAEKTRLEIEQMKEAARLRNDPNAAIEYGARSSGLTVPDATALDNNIRGVRTDQFGPPQEGQDALPQIATPMPEVNPQQADLFRAATAALMANKFATGKTNAEQLTKAGGQSLIDMFRAKLAQPGMSAQDRTANLEAIGPGGNAGAVAPYRQNAAGTSEINAMSGEAFTPNTLTAAVQNALTTDKSATEKAKKGELGTRSEYNVAHAGESRANTDVHNATAADIRAGRPRSYKPVDPVQAEARISAMTSKEYDALPRDQRKRESLEQYRNRRRAEITGKAKAAGSDLSSELNTAHAAITAGADPKKVHERFRARMGVDFPDDPEED